VFVARLTWACGAVGSAPEWHSGGHRFEPGQVHQTFIPSLDPPQVVEGGRGYGGSNKAVSVERDSVRKEQELGRYFVCECKDWKSPADFTVMAKFCRALDSIKSRFGVLFSKNGLSGVSNSQFAAREQLKVFQDRGIVIVVIDEQDLRSVASGATLTQLLRRRYEAVRLDLRGSAGVDC
jgi:hypothetical protein